MNYKFFDSLSRDDAKLFLDLFLESERQALTQVTQDAARAGVHLDFSISSLGNALNWMASQIRVHYEPVPKDLPSWIRQAHTKGLTQFDDNSKGILLGAAFYLGECFARLPGLRWDVGDADYMEKNMPVIAGFRGGLELPPMVVVENVFARIADGKEPLAEISSTIDAWLRDCPSQ